MTRVYLDYAATTPVDPAVADVMRAALLAFPGNPSSLYEEGRAARSALEGARSDIARRIGAHPEEIVFCGSGTESDVAAVLGIARQAAATGRSRHVVISAFEHHAVLEAAVVLEREGFEVERVGPDNTGRIDPEAVGQALNDRTALVSIMHANNEIGTVQDVSAIAHLAHARGAYVHTDAAQSLGKLDIDVDALGVDALSAAGHKIYAPKGTGILFLRSGTPFEPLLRGGGQESGRRSGTESVAGAIALARALELMDDERPDGMTRLGVLRDSIERGLSATASPVVVHGAGAQRLPHLSNIGIPGCEGGSLLMLLDEAGFSVSAGSACASGSGRASHVLQAIGAGRDPHEASLRVTVGRWTSTADVERFVDAAAHAIARLRGR
ncbi:MAG: cysteine desulfurase [Coriobacteriia bacterium]|nr:cysteine desulfurase [Coriobacteriia bacterium]MBN2848530.1 cysteine desulfurase [Coriobacteriia bacterium]